MAKPGKISSVDIKYLVEDDEQLMNIRFNGFEVKNESEARDIAIAILQHRAYAPQNLITEIRINYE